MADAEKVTGKRMRMGMDPLVSIIVPVCNADQRLLASCLDSLLGQTYRRLEIVLVDDGSTDGTGAFCDAAAMKDKRIRVLHQTHKGVGAARNRGTQAAQGDYLFYVDGDDLLSPVAVQEGLADLLREKVDLVIAGVRQIRCHEEFSDRSLAGQESVVLKGHELDGLKGHYLAQDEDRFRKIKGSGYINRGAYCRLMKKELALSNPFAEGLPFGEDLIWNMDLLDRCRSVCVVPNVWVGYCMSPSSAIRKFHGDRIEKVEAYLALLWEKQGEYCSGHMAAYAKAVAVELYCILRYELLSPDQPLGCREKNDLVCRMLGREPWKVLTRKGIYRQLSPRHRLMIALCRRRIWQPVFRTVIMCSGIPQMPLKYPAKPVAKC
ncbi:MAG: glycosyltransferase family 2 protein [Blautia sp.]|nr:glycosyltransferase family 2 protein [Blautia sp.]